MPYTPGPWRVNSVDADDEDVEILGPDHANEIDCQYIADVFGLSNNTASNARLIAQAPAMYELLKELEWSGPTPYRGDGMCPQCYEWRTYVHRPDCKLAAVLKAVEGE